MNESENHAMQAWREDIKERAAGHQHAINRGVSRTRNGKAPGSWRCEGRDQAADQLDIWQCVEAAEADEGGEQG